MSKLLISCDIQPQYLGGVNFPLEKFVAYMREFDKVLYFFNNKYDAFSDLKIVSYRSSFL